MTGRLEACIRLAKKIGIENKILLDVGCSNGWFCKIALEEKAKEVYAIEPEKEKLALAKAGSPKAIIKEGVAGKLDFPKNKFDIVTLFDVLEHVPVNSEPQVFNEINKVLKPKGYLLISTPFRSLISMFGDPAWYFGHRHYSEDGLKILLSKAGFKVKEFETRGGFWELISMWILYISKWIFHIKMPFEQWLDKRRIEEFKRKGNTEVFLIAQKN